LFKIIPVILSGGSGTRLWPLSRKNYPKQYLSLLSEKTMLQETILRLNGLDNLSNPVIICNSIHRFLVAEQCQQINIDNPTILLEPVGRNTAPAIAAAAIQSIKDSGDSLLLVLSADHVIEDIKAFHDSINIAVKHALEGRLSIFGIVPTNANTGYGYINSSEENIHGSYKVKNFIEKPSLQNAKSYIAQGNYLWNSGMFMFKASVLIDELNSYLPDTMSLVTKAVDNSTRDLDFIRLEKQAFELIPNNSIDCALMEKSNNVVVIPLDAQWSDIGSWSALYDIGEKDQNGNVLKGDVIVQDTTNTYVSANNHMIAVIGVDNLIVVDTPDATFISTIEKTHKVKSIINSLESKGRNEFEEHRKVHRPWGWFDSIESGKHFQVKKLHVFPGSKLSLQMHHKRAEHWIVVNGLASVINGEDAFILREGESTFIPIGVTHSLENKTSSQLEIIEIQSGAYLGEDDIVRFEDIYGRFKDES